MRHMYLRVLSLTFVLLVPTLLKAQVSNVLRTPDAPAMNRRAPDVVRIRLGTTRGVIRLERHRAWAPHGVDRFYNLVRHGFYNHAPVFRVRAGMWAQFGINGDQ